MVKKNIIISEGNRPLWQLVIAAIHYTAIITLLFFYFIDFEFSFETEVLKKGIRTIELVIFLLPSALAFSVVKDVLFDLNNKKYKIQYCVGPIKFGKWKKLPEIEYVSVFKQRLANGNFVFEANLWYSTNKHFNIFESELKNPVFLLGKNVAKALNIDLLDATVPNDYKWIEIEIEN
ncbi:hypothetical protein [Maribacter dokdonensis]|uniref:hypothetical protein n=1 Tax=Maribacter dokdonensis TaxID=320912 RepID=UPI003297DA48